jgi:aldehyde oxidoreductase
MSDRRLLVKCTELTGTSRNGARPNHLYRGIIMSLRKVTLHINGIDKVMVCDPDRDSLADVLRRQGLTGTKIGCNAGQCGACTVLLDGAVVRSCIKRMKMIKEHASVVTIEGLGTPEHLHPLQQAFITYASVQCGFCSPGFILSAKALLEENPSPNRQEVRDWFTRHHNLCRCTGYKPIVDAVMAAGAVLRGEKTMKDITFTPPADGRIYSSHHPKPTAQAKVLGQCDFGDDLSHKMPPETLHLAVVMARMPHASIASLDTAGAEAMPGVVKVITAKDVKGTNRLVSPLPIVRGTCDGLDHPVICDTQVSHYGDVVAVVAAKSRAQAREAATAVAVTYAPLPVLVNFMEAAASDAPRIHANTPNVYLEQPLFKGEDADAVIRSSACHVSGSFSTTRQPHLPIEPDTVQAYPDGEGGLVIHCKSQNLFGNIAVMASAIGLPKERIRLVLNPTGGSFGYTMSAAAYALTGACALDLGVPVSLTMSYAEHQHFTGKRSPIHANVRLACDAEGKFTAMDFHVGVDHGAYSDLAANLTSKICRFFGYPYNIPNMRGLVQTAFTNNAFGIAYRAFGSPQVYTASEQLVDMLAETMNMDPFELRYRNIAREGDTCANDVPYREYPMQAMMDIMRPHYEKARSRVISENTPEKKRGIGLSWGGYHVGKCPDHAEVVLELNPDGTVTHCSTWEDMGQGADIGALVHVHEALRPLSLAPQQIHLIQNDTGLCPDTGPASASRSHHVAGQATLDAADKLLSAMRKPDGTYRTYQEMVEAGLPTRYSGKYDTTGVWADIDPDTGHGYGAFAQNYCLFLTEVEVEVATGETRVLGVTLVTDIGTVGNYQAVLGQAWGSYSHSVGYALQEEYSDVKKHASLVGAGIPSCNRVPDDINVIFHQTPRANGPHGSTGCSEAFQSSGHVSILNAIADAVGARIFTLPATPQKVKASMEAKARGEDGNPGPWDLGCDLYARLAYLQANPIRK